MAITPLDAELIPEFLGLPRRLYAGDRRWIPGDDAYLQQQLNAASADAAIGRAATSAHFVGRARGRVVARVSASINDALRDADGTPVGALGFFEAENDAALAEDLIGTARTWLRDRGVTRAYGPLNFDIWHGYRCMTEGFDAEPFAGEPYNKRYYPQLLSRSGACERHVWHSFEGRGQSAASAIRDHGREQLERLSGQGYRLAPLNLGRLEDELRKLHGVMSLAFARFPAFTPIGVSEFCALTLPLAAALVPGAAWFVYDAADDCCGFAIALLDLADRARGARWLATPSRVWRGRGRERVLFQLIGVTPTVAKRSPGLGRALVTRVMNCMLAAGYDRYVAPLISRGNVSRGLVGATGALHERRYALYEWR